MAKVSPLINNFSAGEFGPLTSARVDLDRYGQSTEEMTNFIPTIQGAAQKRSGTKYVTTAAVNTGNCRLESFVFSNEQAYVLEFSDSLVRFYTQGAIITNGGNPVELITPYASSDIFELSFTQSNDILYVFHKDYAPRKIIRTSDTAWGIVNFDFQFGPYNYNPVYNQPAGESAYWYIKPSGTSGNINISIAPSGGLPVVGTSNNNGEVQVQFSPTAYGAHFPDGTLVYITGITGTTEANGTWSVRKIDNNNYVLIGSVYANAYISGGSGRYAAFSSTDVGRWIRIFDVGLTPDAWVYCQITAYTSPIQVDATVSSVSSFSSTSSQRSDFSKWGMTIYSDTTGYPSSGSFFEDRLWMVGPEQNICASETGDYESFRLSEDDGTVIDSNGISFKLNTNRASSCVWSVPDEKGLLIGTTGSEFLIKSASTTSGITPTSITAKETTAFGSASVQPVKAGKAVVFLQASQRKLREFNYFFDVDGFRCQDLNQLAHHITKTGIKQIAIQKQPEQIVWAVRSDGVLIGMTYERDIDGLRVAWHKHILGGAQNSNGNEVDVLSVCCIPTDDNSYDEVWMVVKRLIDGSTSYSVEYIGAPFNDEVEQEDSIFLDCSLTYNSPITISAITQSNPATITATAHGLNDGDKIRIDNVEGMTELNGNVYVVANKTANDFDLTDYDGNNVSSLTYGSYLSGGEIRKLVTSISGLTHLNGQQVVAYGDGANIGTYTVSAGAITLDEPAAVVTVGLSYEAKIKLPRLEAGASDGTALGKTRRIHRLGAAVYRTLGLKYGQDFDNMKSFEFQDGDDQLNQAPPLYTGVLTTEVEFDYDFNNQICLKSNEPNNCTILAVMPQMHTQDR